MSHMTKTKTKVKNMQALAAACRDLGLKLETTNKSARYYAGSRYKCDAVIKVPGSDWDIAVKESETKRGEYDLLMDSYGSVGNELAKKVGKGCSKIEERYHVNEVLQHCEAQGLEAYERVVNGVTQVCVPDPQVTLGDVQQ